MLHGTAIVSFNTDMANALSSYMTPEGNTSSYFEKPFWRNKMEVNGRNGLKKCLLARDLSASQRARHSLENSHI